MVCQCKDRTYFSKDLDDFNLLNVLKDLKDFNVVFAGFHPLPAYAGGGLMFYDADYPNAVNLGFRETDSLGVFIFVLPTP